MPTVWAALRNCCAKLPFLFKEETLMKSDIEIAQEAKMKPIAEVAASLGLADEDVIPYGRYKAKINHRLIHKATKQGKMILVTAISPTPAGEGKTTTSVGLADAMNALGKKTMLCLREPSLGPVFGIKGGAAGGGYAQVVPMEDINLHFTGDLHAIGTANNLLAAMIDNSIQQGNPLNIDPRRITWKRCMDMNDRQLRFIVDGLGGKVNGTPREDGFDITVASEVMAIFCLATSITDLKERLSKIVCAYTYDGKPVTAGEIGAAGAMTALLKDALDPNLVQTLENNPAIIHGSDLLDGKRAAGKKVLVVGGGMVGCETAAFLGEQEHDVTVIEFRDTVGADVIHEHRVYLMKDFEDYGIKEITGAKVCKFYEDGVEYETADGVRHETRGYDSVILSMGFRNYNPLEEKIKDLVPETHVIGDAIRARRALDATKEAYAVASKL